MDLFLYAKIARLDLQVLSKLSVTYKQKVCARRCGNPACKCLEQQGVILLPLKPCHADKQHIFFVDSLLLSPGLPGCARRAVPVNRNAVWDHLAVPDSVEALDLCCNIARDCNGDDPLLVRHSMEPLSAP